VVWCGRFVAVAAGGGVEYVGVGSVRVLTAPSVGMVCGCGVPGIVLSRLTQTAFGTQLTNAEVDELFSDFGIAEHDVVDYEQFMLALTSGFVQLES
jgi:hypothetical protein